jgi:thiosulfate dehydrogenase (quinone)
LTYNYYRGSVISPYHGGPVSPSTHHWELSAGVIGADGSVSFRAYADAGTPAEPSNVVLIRLLDASGKAVEVWDSAALASLPEATFRNEFDYQKFHAGTFGIVGPVGAIATIDLPGELNGSTLSPGAYTLKLSSVNDHVWSLPVSLGQ